MQLYRKKWKHMKLLMRLVSPSILGTSVIKVHSTFQTNYERWAIDCFKCVSIDGDNKPCDDPFHNNGSLALLESPCLGGRKGRDGLFPATACLKIAGIYDESGASLMVRGCALDSGTLTTDSEIIRMSHCGGFYFDDNVSDQFVNLLWRVACWLWETIELVLIVIFDCLARLIELILVMMKLIFQVICFIRDLCIDAMQTFANVFRGIVNVISSISCDDIEDFASACIVNPHARLLDMFGQRVTQSDNNNNPTARSHSQDTCLHERKTGRRLKRRYNRRYRSASRKNN
ncbi:Uncharacterized protein DBV15_09448 [Temnothorax longispinosus]|uniref:Protein sleepless n=1 Tax=Temnothorax longispinosus TaxID=300112 RepID=A0A4S2KDE1_9HYME|nr:Uncharacterized protein DBV15_09448 [Temnothorax longispinosus]